MSVDKRELALNAAHWMEQFKRANVRGLGVGAIFLFFNTDDPTGSAVCVGSVNREGVRAACEGILKKLRRGGSVIINPNEV